jgi:hypothetical protein
LLDTQDVLDTAVVMLNDPPGFYYHTGMSSVVVPNGGVDVLLDVCARYAVDYLVLDFNHPLPLALLYEGQVVSDRLAAVAAFRDGSVKVWRVDR